MEMLESLAKYSIIFLLLTSNTYIKCAEDDSKDTSGQLHQELTPAEDGSANQEEHIQKTKGEHGEIVEKSKFCDKEEGCDRESAAGSSLVKDETASAAQNEQKESKTEEKLDKFDLEPEVLSDEKSTEAEKGFSENEHVNKESSYEQEKTEDIGDRNALEEKENSTDANVIDNETRNEKEEAQELKNESIIDKPVSESNSTLYRWLKFLLDPIIEEFKDGIYPKLKENTNNSVSNVSVESENTTAAVEVANVTVTEPTNVTETENVTDSSRKVKFQCIGKNVTDNINATVKLITTAQLLQMLNFEKNDTENVTDCLLVMFYAPWCHFCAKIAPYFNALARAFPQLDFVAVDTAQFSNLLARFGTVSVPNILVFHQSRAAVKFNQTERTFENLVTFVTNSTGLEANITVNVTEADFLGPVPSVPTNEPDYLLLMSWIFVIFCSTCMFVKSNKGQQWINRVRVLWQEHQHID